MSVTIRDGALLNIGTERCTSVRDVSPPAPRRSRGTWRACLYTSIDIIREGPLLPLAPSVSFLCRGRTQEPKHLEGVPRRTILKLVRFLSTGIEKDGLSVDLATKARILANLLVNYR
jgi:hypothetical protein